jgi:hypothetical protein
LVPGRPCFAGLDLPALSYELCGMSLAFARHTFSAQARLIPAG